MAPIASKNRKIKTRMVEIILDKKLFSWATTIIWPPFPLFIFDTLVDGFAVFSFLEISPSGSSILEESTLISESARVSLF